MTRFGLVDLLAEDPPRDDRELPSQDLGEFWLSAGGRSHLVTTGRRILPAPVDQDREEGA